MFSVCMSHSTPNTHAHTHTHTHIIFSALCPPWKLQSLQHYAWSSFPKIAYRVVVFLFQLFLSKIDPLKTCLRTTMYVSQTRGVGMYMDRRPPAFLAVCLGWFLICFIWILWEIAWYLRRHRKRLLRKQQLFDLDLGFLKKELWNRSGVRSWSSICTST